jgi:thioredoxin reductase (NADPH)
VVEDGQTGSRRTVEARALFVFIGAAPCTGWLGAFIDLDDHGFVKTGIDAERAVADGSASEAYARRAVLETSQPGIFAAGDVRSGSVRRVASAVGEGAMAIRLALESMNSR